MAKYKEQRDESGDLEAYIRASDGATIAIATDNKDYQEVLDWIADGNTPDPSDPYAPSLSAARKKRISEVKEQAKAMYRSVSDQYASQYSMEKLRGETPTALPANIDTWYTDMKSAFQSAKTAINAETDIVTIATMSATWPTAP